MNSSVKDKDNVTKMFVKETKQRLLKSFETFVETNIESQINSLLNKLMEDKIYKYESFVNTIIDHPLISSEINVYKNKIRSLEEKIHQIQSSQNISLEIIETIKHHSENIHTTQAKECAKAQRDNAIEVVKKHSNNLEDKIMYIDDGEKQSD